MTSERIEITLPFDVTAPKKARTALAQWGVNIEADVVVSELVTNALRHGAAPIRLAAIRTPDTVHVEVSDGRHDFGPRPSPPDGGAGLHLVEGFSNAWGITTLPNGGKVVWAEFAA